MEPSAAGYRRHPLMVAATTLGIAGGIGLIAIDAAGAGLAVFGAVIAADVVVAGRSAKRARTAHQRRFDDWARSRGLQPREVSAQQLLERFSLSGTYIDVLRAATHTDRAGRVTVLEVSQAQGGDAGGRPTVSTGLLLQGPQTRTALEIRPARKLRLPSRDRAHDTGVSPLDEQVDIRVRRGDPHWLAHPAVADAIIALVSMRLRELQVDDDAMLATFPQVAAERWDELLDGASALAAAAARHCTDPPTR